MGTATVTVMAGFALSGMGHGDVSGPAKKTLATGIIGAITAGGVQGAAEQEESCPRAASGRGTSGSHGGLHGHCALRRLISPTPVKYRATANAGGSAAMPLRTTAVLALLLCWLVLPLSAHAEWRQRTEAIMGTRIFVEVWADEAAKGDDAIEAVMGEMRRIDELMSHYKPESQLSQINARAAQEPVQVDPELFDLIKLSTHYSEITEGAFDITYASVGHLYDYPHHVRPSEDQIKAALPAVNWRNMLFDPVHHTVRFEHPGMRIDLGGIGKGYAVDRGIGILQARGIKHAVVTAGGDSRIIGDRMGRPWLVGIRNPDDASKVVTRIPLVDSAMSTSGDYERFFDEKGVRYHHIIDPRTGHSASKVRSATILAPTATQTDGMSKTAFVLGPEKALEIINRMPEYDAIFVTPDGRILYSNGLRPPNPRDAATPAAKP
jgi:thiamine biosynthesis lipoprotein